MLIAVGLMAATGSVALTSVVDVSFSSGPATARLVTQSLVESASTSSTRPALHATPDRATPPTTRHPGR